MSFSFENRTSWMVMIPEHSRTALEISKDLNSSIDRHSENVCNELKIVSLLSSWELSLNFSDAIHILTL